MRNQIWIRATARLTPGQWLPKWAVALRWALFPLDSFYWHMSKSRGYSMMDDTWLIDGVRVHGGFFKQIPDGFSGDFRMKREGDILVLVRLSQLDRLATQEQSK